MKKQIYLAIAKRSLLFLFFSALVSCIQEETFSKATVETSQVTSITEATAICGGIITSDGGSEITIRGVCWSTSPTPTIENDTTIAAAGSSVFTSLIKGLSPGTTYYIRAYVVNKGGVAYGFNSTFTTKTFSITTTPISVFSLTATSVIGGGNIISDGDSSSLTVKARGVCWTTFPTPTIENSKTSDGVGGGRFSSRVDSLIAFTTYYLRAYATNNNCTIYGNEVSFTTLNGIVGLTTNAVSSIKAYTATCGGKLTSDGGAIVTERGLCWNTSPGPTTANSKLINVNGTSAFVANITGLSPSTTYYVRTYAINSVGISYGNEVNFITQSGIVGLTTNNVSSIKVNTAISGGTIASDGGAPVTERGICWSIGSSPTTANNKTVDGSGTETFTANITGLAPSTTYNVRSYAINSVGTSYGNEISFMTQSGVIGITTDAATSINALTATSGGTISTDGGSIVTDCGICWSTSQNPTLLNDKITKGAGLNSYTTNLSGLTPSTTYYLRAYATNSVGTTYGNEVSFTTQSGIIGLTTMAVSSISSFTATSGGAILADGGSTVTERGVCWNTSPKPTTENNKTSNGSGISSYIANLSGLSPRTVYYVRAYAINSVGISYGNEVFFTSYSAPTTIFSEEFSGTLGNFSTYSFVGDQLWAGTNYGATMTGFVGSVYNANEDWLISPAIDLTDRSSAILSFMHTINKGVVANMTSNHTMWISTNYTSGSPSVATWIQIPIPNYPTGSDWTFINSGNISLPSTVLGHSNLRLAFKYLCTTYESATWEIKTLKIISILP